MEIRNDDCVFSGEIMSEIPMPAGEPYQPPPKSSGYGTCCKIIGVVCVLLIIGMIIIAMAFMGGLASMFGGIFGGNGATYGERTLATSNNLNIDLFPTYFFGQVMVASSEVQTSIAPDIHFYVGLDNTGTDSVTVTIHCAVYDCDQTTFDSLTWSELDTSYLIEESNYTDSVSDFFNIHNYSDTYVWVIWFDAPLKTSTWSVDIDVTLRYNWGA
jgi:hypothetical protein